MVEPLSMDDLTNPNNIVYIRSHNSVVGKYEIEEEKMKQCQECSFSESQDWNSHLVCDNGVLNGMRLCAYKKMAHRTMSAWHGR